MREDPSSVTCGDTFTPGGRLYKRLIALAAAFMLAVSVAGCARTPNPSASQPQAGEETPHPSPAVTPGEETPHPSATQTPSPQGEGLDNVQIDRMGVYDSKEEVSLYLVTYGVLPDNYVTKEEAKRHGWDGGNVEAVMGEGFCIGGDRFGNFEGNLPEGEDYIECDIDTIGYKSRGSRRLVYTKDITAIYYTHNHYDTFETVYIDGVFTD
ncbi:MAG: ribonuclease [Lachnospiraceae bacterium]|nr:ribonuclease [Lachnospiraceae bacterium]